MSNLLFMPEDGCNLLLDNMPTLHFKGDSDVGVRDTRADSEFILLSLLLIVFNRLEQTIPRVAMLL